MPCRKLVRCVVHTLVPLLALALPLSAQRGQARLAGYAPAEPGPAGGQVTPAPRAAESQMRDELPVLAAETERTEGFFDIGLQRDQLFVALPRPEP